MRRVIEAWERRPAPGTLPGPYYPVELHHNLESTDLQVAVKQAGSPAWTTLLSWPSDQNTTWLDLPRGTWTITIRAHHGRRWTTEHRTAP